MIFSVQFKTEGILTETAYLKKQNLQFCFKSGICLLIAPVPVHCFSITFTYLNYRVSVSIFGF